jgi:diguanylate cyclase (GGDEF)-like protein
LSLGAIDFISKPFDTGELRARIGVALRLIELHEKNIVLANTDELTSLINRRHFFEVFEREILQAKIKSRPLSLMLLDIDHFKKVNDTFGHLTGDMVLKHIGSIFKNSLYPLDIPARYGGEEFIVLMPGTSLERAMQAAERLRQLIQNYNWTEVEERLKVTLSIGLISVKLSNLVNCEDMVKKADTALYVAKQKGRNCIVSWDQIQSDISSNRPVIQSLDVLESKVLSMREQLRGEIIAMTSTFEKTLSRAIKDPFMAGHGKRVREYAISIAKDMDLPDDLTKIISVAALLHDIGKIGLCHDILNKSSELSEKEENILKTHPVAAAEILTPVGVFEDELQIIRQHHERFDGSGYPKGLKAKQISIGARILAVADTFDRLTYKKNNAQELTLNEALEFIKERSEAYFDPEVAEAFINLCQNHANNWPLKEDAKEAIEASNTNY